MPDPEDEAVEGGEELSSHPDIEEVHLAPETPARNIDVLQFFEPGADPVATMDFRPTTILFKNDEDVEDEPLEDGHGNFRHPVMAEPRHPSLPIETQPYDVQPEGQEASESDETKQDSPLGK